MTNTCACGCNFCSAARSRRSRRQVWRSQCVDYGDVPQSTFIINIIIILLLWLFVVIITNKNYYDSNVVNVINIIVAKKLNYGKVLSRIKFHNFIIGKDFQVKLCPTTSLFCVWRCWRHYCCTRYTTVNIINNEVKESMLPQQHAALRKFGLDI